MKALGLLVFLIVASEVGSFLVKQTVDAPPSNTARLVSPSTQQQDDTLLKPPGRPTPRFLSFLFDDSIKLLNPKTMSSYQVERQQQYGPVFKTNIFFRPTVFVTDEESMADLASEESKKNLKAFFPPHHQKLFGPHSVLVQSGEQHARLRRLIQPCMSPAMMKDYQQVIDDSIHDFLQEMTLNCTADYVTMVPKIRSFFISLVLQILLGTTNLENDELANDLSIWSKGLLAPPLMFLPWSTAAKALRARKRVIKQLTKLIEANPKDGLLGKLLSFQDENGDQLSTNQVIDNVFTLIFAGSDTTASAVTSLWMILSLHPEVKAKLQERPDLMDPFVKKVLQTHPPAPFSMRLNTNQPLVVGGYEIPENWLVVYGFAGVLHSESTGWMDLSDDKRPSTASLAFGGGPRMCPGRFLASTELLSFCRELVNLDWRLDPNQDLEQRYTPGLFPVDGLRLKFISQEDFSI